MADKRLSIMRIKIKQRSAFLLNLVADILTFPVYIAATYFLWDTVLKNTNIDGVTLGYMLTYYIVTFIVMMVVAPARIGSEMSSEIRRGTMTDYLIRPMKYLDFKLWDKLASTSFNALIYLPVLLLLWFLFKLEITTDPLLILLFIVSLVMAIILEFLTYLAVGSTAFWLIDNKGFMSIFTHIRRFLSGTLIPLHLLPMGIQNIVFLLPFKYSGYIQTQILMGKMSANQAFLELVFMAIWILIIYFVATLIWRAGEKKYNGYGV